MNIFSRTLLLVLVTTCLLCVTNATLAREPGSDAATVLKGKHYEVRLDFEHKALAKQVLDVAESAWKHTVAFLKRKGDALESPLIIHVYKTIESYKAAEKKLTNGIFATNLFFSHHGTRSVHGAWVPDSSPDVRKALGASHHFLRQIAHEASHVAVFSHIPNYRSHPDWLAEGLAMHIAERVSKEQEWISDAASSPFYGARMILCKRLRRRGLLPGPRALLQEDLSHLSTSDKYAVWWAFFRFLENDKSKMLQKILSSAWRLGGGAQFDARLYGEIRENKETRDETSDVAFDKLDLAFRAHVDGMKPRWEEAFRSLDIDGNRWRQRAFASSNAICWREPSVGSKYTIEGSVTIYPSSNPQANVLIGDSDEGFFSVAIRAGYGVTILEYQKKGSKWINRASVKCDLEFGKPISFRVGVDGRDVTAVIKGSNVAMASASHDLVGRWGVGVQAGGGSLWEGVKHSE